MQGIWTMRAAQELGSFFTNPDCFDIWKTVPIHWRPSSLIQRIVIISDVISYTNLRTRNKSNYLLLTVIIIYVDLIACVMAVFLIVLKKSMIPLSRTRIVIGICLSIIVFRLLCNYLQNNSIFKFAHKTMQPNSITSMALPSAVYYNRPILQFDPSLLL